MISQTSRNDRISSVATSI